MTLIYYVIRHKSTGQLMPEVKRRGYTHWNPNTNSMPNTSIGIPRLLHSRRQAHRCIVQWASLPNAKTVYSMSDEYSEELDIDIKLDGRKKDDLEIIEARLVIGNE